MLYSKFNPYTRRFVAAAKVFVDTDGDKNVDEEILEGIRNALQEGKYDLAKAFRLDLIGDISNMDEAEANEFRRKLANIELDEMVDYDDHLKSYFDVALPF